MTSDRIVERLLHGVFGDFVEDDAADRNPRLEDLRQVPADRLAFAIRVGRQQQLGRVLDGGLEVRHLLPLVARDDVVRREVLLDIDTESAPVLLLDLLRDVRGRLREIANVTVARLDPVLVPEEAAQRLGLRGRLDDNQRFCCHFLERCLFGSLPMTLTRSERPQETTSTCPTYKSSKLEIEQPRQ